MTKEEIEEYNSIEDLPIVKRYCELLRLFCLEVDNKAPQEIYKEINGNKYIIELPFDKLTYVDNHKIGYVHYGYDALIMRKNQSTYYCLGLCNVTKEKCIELLEKAILGEKEND